MTLTKVLISSGADVIFALNKIIQKLAYNYYTVLKVDITIVVLGFSISNFLTKKGKKICYSQVPIKRVGWVFQVNFIKE